MGRGCRQQQRGKDGVHGTGKMGVAHGGLRIVIRRILHPGRRRIKGRTGIAALFSRDY
jgi:hypothetical protein